MKKIKKYIEDNKYTLIFIFLLFALSLFMSSLFQKESDYFWHISAGKYMFDNKLILTKDVFSWFLNGTYWMSHEWGFDILIYIFNILFVVGTTALITPVVYASGFLVDSIICIATAALLFFCVFFTKEKKPHYHHPLWE